MGTVYCVLDKALNKKFAMKVLRKELAADREIAKRFEREVTSTQSLNHPNLVSVYAHGVNPDGSPFLIMDLIEGETLAARIKRVGELPPNEAIDIFIQVVDAISHAHEKGILHRDLKPSNIMITSDEIGHPLVKVVDLGIAKVLPTTGRDTLNLTRTGEIFGSPLYMSPEQCQGKPVDARCDIYSTGCVMYETLTGHPPFEDANPVKIILAHMYEPPLPIRSNLINEGLQAAVMSCLQKLPDNRYYQSMDALLRDLQAIKDGKRPLVELDTGKKRIAASVRRMIAFVAVPVIVVLLSVFFYLKDDIQLGLNIMYGRGTNPRDFVISKNASAYNRPFVLLEEAALTRKLDRTKSDDLILEAISTFEQRGDFQNMAFACEQFLDRPSEDNRLPTSKVTDMLYRAHSDPKPTPSRGMGVFAVTSPPLLSRPQLGTSILRIAGNYEYNGRYEEAKKLYETSIKWGEQFSQRYPWLLSEALLKYSQFLKLHHEDEKSSQLLKRAFESAEEFSAKPISVIDLEHRSTTLSMIGHELLRRGDVANARRAFELDKNAFGIACSDAIANPQKLPDVSSIVSNPHSTELLTKVQSYCDNLNYETIHAVLGMLLSCLESQDTTQKNNPFSSFSWTTLVQYQTTYAFYLTLCGHAEEADKYAQQAQTRLKESNYGHQGSAIEIYENCLLEHNFPMAKRVMETAKNQAVAWANQMMKEDNKTEWSPWNAEPIKIDQTLLDILNASDKTYAECEKTIPDASAILASKLLNEGKPLEASKLLEKCLGSPDKGNRPIYRTLEGGPNDRTLRVDLFRRLSQCFYKAGMHDRAIDTMKKAMDTNTSKITQARLFQEYSEMLVGIGDNKGAQAAHETSKNLLLAISRADITKHIRDNKRMWAQNLDFAEYQWTKDLYKTATY